MKKAIISTLIIGSIVTSNMAMANTEEPHGQQEQLVGFGSGLLLGAAVGGPVGAVIGAITGGVIGKSVADDEKLTAQDVKLQQQQVKLAKLNEQQQDYQHLSHQYRLAQNKLQQLGEMRTLKQLDLGLNVQFRTGSAQIEPLYQKQLEEVAKLMNAQPELKLDLSGFADRQGQTDLNQKLSEKRISSVKSLLTGLGVDEARLTAKAYGDTAPIHQEQTLENNVFDRRVTLQLSPEMESSLTAKQ
ncbi:sortase-associated OmpA-like protein PdsO [Parashewanella curva]|uniref:Sortase-associated OmpA-like protein PdsO n=1 Tax=Parashewanella curva TaxID=2338552 RepID=A0A3L8PZ35_9GAMM|nr:sortase-associated OmpA-like protein PdsO [Parashewanella curva]RLV60667.1 sortase-associated OmpA-like protein PdsO [Parashewanella curva]